MSPFYTAPTDPCIISPYAANSDGYAHVELQRNGRRVTIKHHRLVYAEAHNMSPEDMKGFLVMHKCDVRNCINPAHLMLGTDSMNMRDMVNKGRNVGFTVGNKVGATKMTAELAAELRTRKREPQVSLAKEYGISVPLVSMIMSGKRWK